MYKRIPLWISVVWYCILTASLSYGAATEECTWLEVVYIPIITVALPYFLGCLTFYNSGK